MGYTVLGWTDYTRAAPNRGVLVRRPMFTDIEPDGVREPDGSLTPLDVILWATGFRADIAHLEPLYLVNELGGVAACTEPRCAASRRVHLVRFGPSKIQPSAAEPRRGRDAARALKRYLRDA